MATYKSTRSNRSTAKAPETSLRHLWLAGLGAAAIARRESLGAGRQALARIASLRQRALRLAGEVQGNACGGIASIREQGEARVGRFNAEVEARLAPVLAGLGLKPKPAARARKATKQAAKATRRATGRANAAPRRAGGKRR